MLSTGYLCPAVHHGSENPASAFERQHAAAFRFGLLEDGVLLDILIREHDAIDCLLPTTAVDTVLCSRVWHANHRGPTRPLLTQPGRLRRLHLSRNDGRPLPLIRSRLCRYRWLDTCRVRLLGPHHVTSDALCLRHLVGFDWWWVCWQLDWLC